MQSKAMEMLDTHIGPSASRMPRILLHFRHISVGTYWARTLHAPQMYQHSRHTDPESAGCDLMGATNVPVRSQPLHAPNVAPRNESSAVPTSHRTCVALVKCHHRHPAWGNT